MAQTYAYTDLINAIKDLGHGEDDNLKQKRALINRSVREVSSRVDLRSSKRRAAMSPALFDNQYFYTKPTDMKGEGLIDLVPQIDRPEGFRGEWILTRPEQFDRYKRSFRNLVAVSDYDNIGKLLVSAVVDSAKTTIHEFDSLTADGTVDADSDNSAANNDSIDNNNYWSGTGSLNFDIDTSGVSAVIKVTGMSDKDLTKYEGQPLFLRLWIPSGGTTSLSSVALHWGDDSDNHYIRSVTTTNEGNSFQEGLNVIRLDWDDNVTQDGSPTIASINYVSVVLTFSAALSTQLTDWRLDLLVARRGIPHDVVYYSKYLWQNSGGTYIENSTADTDTIVADTDEVDLIGARVDYNIAKANKDKDMIKLYREDYAVAEANYKMKYPSEAKVITESYYEFGSLGDDVGDGDVFDKDTT